MKYASLLEADCCVLDTFKADMVALGHHIQFHAKANVMPGFIVFGRISNTTPGLKPTRLGSRDKDSGTWYMDLVSLVGMTPSC